MLARSDKLSIVVVTFNRLNYLGSTIQSILNQSYSNFELIIIGDGYQSEVAEYVVSLNDERVSYSFVQHYGYPGPARNYGIYLSSGEYIAFCDDDDIWLREKLFKQITELNITNADLCFTNRYCINEVGERIYGKKIKWIPSVVTIEKLFHSNFITYSSVVVKRRLFTENYLFSEERDYKGFEDYHLWLRLLSVSRFILVDDFLVQYRIHSGNISGKLSSGARTNIKLFKDVFRLIEYKSRIKFWIILVANLKFLYYSIRRL
jgi:glycosyltransferase involved in cell wall biosynthesis